MNNARGQHLHAVYYEVKCATWRLPGVGSLRQWMSQFGEFDIRTKKVSRESSSKWWKSGVELHGGQSARVPRFAASPLSQSWINMTNSCSLAFSFSRLWGASCCSDDKGSLCPGHRHLMGFSSVICRFFLLRVQPDFRVHPCPWSQLWVEWRSPKIHPPKS